MTRIRMLGVALAAIVASAPALAQDCNTNTGRCKVDVLVFGNCPTDSIRFDPDTLRLAGRHNVEIVWTLPQGYLFCPARGDGVKFKDPSGNPDGQFFGREYDDEAGTCYLKYRLRNRNEPWTHQRPAYRYDVQFTSPSGATCSRDPFIKNG